MAQLIGVLVILLGLIIIGVWVWLTWFKGASVGQTTIGKYVTAVLESAQLTTTLGYVELLSHVDAVEKSPEALKACDVLAETLWAAAKAAWKEQAAPTTVTIPTTTTPADGGTVRVATVTGQIVSVPVVE